jgi:hypothetical protein
LSPAIQLLNLRFDSLEKLMKSISAKCFLVLTVLFAALSITIPARGGVETARATIVRTTPPAPVFDDKTRLAEFSQRRARVAAAIGDNSILILFSTEPRVYTNDVDYEDRQENNLYYLTGLKRRDVSVDVGEQHGARDFVFATT